VTGAPPPYRIETERLVIRCWEPRDAPLLKEAIDASLDHVQPWMPWAAHEPQPVEDKIELLRGHRGRFDLGEDFVYGILDRDESRVLGGSALYTRAGEGAFEIGYWIRADSIGRGLASEAAAALTCAALAYCDVDRIEVHIDPANRRSARIPLRLGFVEEARLRRRLPSFAGSGLRDVVVFTMLASEVAASPAAATGYASFDAAGRALDRPT
jgi:RimJ/RimL family protein N-acetyltransferase